MLEIPSQPVLFLFAPRDRVHLTTQAGFEAGQLVLGGNQEVAAVNAAVNVNGHYCAV